jgi:hypothetical protein
MSMLKGEPTQPTKKRRGHWGNVAATGIVNTGKEALMINNIGTQMGDLEEDDNGVGICRSTPNSKSPASPVNEKLTGLSPVMSGPAPGSAASPVVLPCYSVGRGVSLPFGQLLPQCSDCHWSPAHKALIAWNSRSDPKQTGVVCLDHGLSNLRDLVLTWDGNRRYRFISPEHEAALRALLA